jgi:hypothetical protein
MAYGARDKKAPEVTLRGGLSSPDKGCLSCGLPKPKAGRKHSVPAGTTDPLQHYPGASASGNF